MQVTERAHTAFEPDMRKQLRPDFGGAHGLDAPTVAGSQLVLRLSVQVQEVTLQALAGQFPAQALPPLPECISLMLFLCLGSVPYSSQPDKFTLRGKGQI